MTGSTRQGLTAAQVRALRAVAEGEVRLFFHVRGEPHVDGERPDVIRRMTDRGLVARMARPMGSWRPLRFTLTDAGREALARENER